MFFAGLPCSLTAQYVAARPSPSVMPPEARLATLPEDRSQRVESGLPLPPVYPLGQPNVVPVEPSADFKSFDLKALLRPRLDFAAEWQPNSEISIDSFDASIQMPVYPIFGPPPPFITAGYSFTNIQAPQLFDLPPSLHEFSLGMAWMRPITR